MGISRETFYVYRRRYLAAGLDGVVPRSRRPRSLPARIGPALEAEICRLRREHRRWGARRIRAELLRDGIDPRAPSTIHQVLRRGHPGRRSAAELDALDEGLTTRLDPAGQV